jgi:phage recombination protein Bet
VTEPTTAVPTRAVVALSPTAPAQIQSANEMAQALKAVQSAIAPDLNPSELQLFAMVAYRSGLDPFARQIHAVKRQGKVTFQTGIDGFRSSAERTGDYRGSDVPVFGPACSCSEVPKPHPEYAQVTVWRMRDGVREAQVGEAYWHEFKPAPGSSGNGDAMWKKMPRNQLAKCAEAMAFRKAFPYVLSDVYSHDEMAQADNGARVLEHRPTAREAVAQRRAEAEAADQAGAKSATHEASDVGGFGPAAAATEEEPAEAEVREVVEDQAPALDVVAKLREHVEKSGMRGGITPAQQTRCTGLVEVLGGPELFRSVVVLAFGEAAFDQPTAAQGQAIVNLADSFGGNDEAFVAAWTAAAGGEPA